MNLDPKLNPNSPDFDILLFQEQTSKQVHALMCQALQAHPLISIPSLLEVFVSACTVMERDPVMMLSTYLGSFETGGDMGRARLAEIALYNFDRAAGAVDLDMDASQASTQVPRTDQN